MFSRIIYGFGSIYRKFTEGRKDAGYLAWGGRGISSKVARSGGFYGS